jgi:hypothetical protein
VRSRLSHGSDLHDGISFIDGLRPDMPKRSMRL